MKYRIRYYYDSEYEYEGYYGECYSENKQLWWIITKCCVTKWGCKREINKYHIKTNRSPFLIDEFELE